MISMLDFAAYLAVALLAVYAVAWRANRVINETIKVDTKKPTPPAPDAWNPHEKHER